jgi:hypothetical protein
MRTCCDRCDGTKIDRHFALTLAIRTEADECAIFDYTSVVQTSSQDYFLRLRDSKEWHDVVVKDVLGNACTFVWRLRGIDENPTQMVKILWTW